MLIFLVPFLGIALLKKWIKKNNCIFNFRFLIRGMQRITICRHEMTDNLLEVRKLDRGAIPVIQQTTNYFSLTLSFWQKPTKEPLCSAKEPLHLYGVYHVSVAS